MQDPTALKIATWNINSVRARLPILMEWLARAKPDVLCLQEIKCVADAFPRAALEDLGYNLAVVGQKSYNGVAIASLAPLEDVQTALPGAAEAENQAAVSAAAGDALTLPGLTTPQARYVEAVLPHGDGVCRICCCYMPNGSPVSSDKFTYKLNWMECLTKHVTHLLTLEEPLVVLGDANIIPKAQDAANIEQWRGGALHHPQSLAAYRRLLNAGLADAAHVFVAPQRAYTYWDYQGGARERNDGIRIDHILLSPQAADLCRAFGVDDWVRDQPRPSDHVPTWLQLASTTAAASATRQ